jgi:hypothetical protein
MAASAVSAVVASSKRRSLVMTVKVPGKILAQGLGNKVWQQGLAINE